VLFEFEVRSEWDPITVANFKFSTLAPVIGRKRGPRSLILLAKSTRPLLIPCKNREAAAAALDIARKNQPVPALLRSEQGRKGRGVKHAVKHP
jgi:hypothetical protein